MSPDRPARPIVRTIGIPCAGIAAILAAALARTHGEPHDVIHPPERQAAAPAEGVGVTVNPPSLLWPLTPGKDTRYAVRLSQDPDFPTGKTIAAENLRWAMFNPHRELAGGSWHWQFATMGKRGTPLAWSPAQTFRIEAGARATATPPPENLLAAMPRDHPRILTTAADLSAYRERGANTERARDLIRAAKRLAQKALPDIAAAGPKQKGKDAFEQKNFAKWASKGLGNDTAEEVDRAVQAFLLTGDAAFAKAAADRAALIASWDPEGFTSPKVSDFADGACMRAMARAYDSCHDALAPEQRDALRAALEFRARRFFEKQINNLEARVFAAHVWQHILREGFEAALALHGECPEADDWIAYVYELWIARVPLLGGEDGAWANGISYFATNFRTLLDMPEMFERFTGAGFFAHPWYRNAPYYLIYCWPPGSASDGFGDGAERTGTPGPGYGEFTARLGARFRDPHALWYARQILGDRYVETVRADAPALPAPQPPAALPQARAFPDAGVVAMHTTLGDSASDLMLAFRSSPFGSYNHMHRDQNSFNLLFGGKRLFQGSGYYIAYGDEHFKGWYTATRAQNSILIDGKGQELGAGGYGRIARFLHGKAISYCLGDASRAYGDAGLTRFRRHVAFLRPHAIVVYDDLEADHDATWSWRLHSPGPMRLEGEDLLGGNDLARARVSLLASAPLNRTIDTRFDPPADNWRGKKNVGETIEYPDQWHFDASTATKARAARFLAIIQLQPAASDAPCHEPKPEGPDIRLGPWRVRAALDPRQPATLHIASDDGGATLAADGGSVRHGGEDAPVAQGRARLHEAAGDLFMECADARPGDAAIAP